MKNKFLLLSAAVLFAFTPMHAGSTVAKSSKEVVIHSLSVKTVTLVDIQQYMEQFGIGIVGYTTITGSENVYARDIKGLNYIIYIQDGNFNGWEQVDF